MMRKFRFRVHNLPPPQHLKRWRKIVGFLGKFQQSGTAQNQRRVTGRPDTSDEVNFSRAVKATPSLAS
jgi:hypothetical protein